ncbi:MAG: hypothetical protein HY581_00040 [Nitrospirae bacterium]|nr:hypothetical protein [Nitrospirota bacterium]
MPVVTLTVLFLCAAVELGATLSVAETADSIRLWNFDADPPGVLPKDLAVGTLFDGRPAGEWRIIAAPNAPSPPHALAQQMNKGAEHAYKVVLVEGTTASDVDLEVSFLAIAGKGDMGGGLIWRAADDRNYYLTRANPLEQNIRIYRVVKGVRHLLKDFAQAIDVKKWHALRVVNRGCRIQVLYDGKQVFDLCDQTFMTGRVGLWTKSDAVTYFDNLRLEILK